MKETKKYHYFYKITNNLNNHFYYGVHNTSNINDGYMGSGKRLHYAYKKYGIENFTKEILKYFDTAADAFKYEAEIVNETLINDLNCYNIVKGGKGSFPESCNKSKVRVYNEEGKCIVVNKDDENYISKKYVGIAFGKKVYKNKITGEYKSLKDENINYNEWEICNKGMFMAKDKNGNYYYINKDDERYKSGILVGLTKGYHHSEETCKKMKETR